VVAEGLPVVIAGVHQRSILAQEVPERHDVAALCGL